MSVGEGINKERCDWCHDTGMLTGYHRDYRGGIDVWEEHADAKGEVRTRKAPGTISVHCNCNLGDWMHRTTDEKIRHRIPTVAQLLQGSGRYSLERQDADDPCELSDAANAFLREWKEWFGFPRPPRGVKGDPIEMSNQLRGRAERLEEESVPT